MKLYTHKYFSQSELKSFIKNNSIKNTKNLLVQIFTSINNKEFILDLISDILLILPSAKIIGTTTSGEITSNGFEEYSTEISFCQFSSSEVSTFIVENISDIDSKVAPKLTDDLSCGAICFSSVKNENDEEILTKLSDLNENLIISGAKAANYSFGDESFIFTQDDIIEDGFVITLFKGEDLKTGVDIYDMDEGFKNINNGLNEQEPQGVFLYASESIKDKDQNSLSSEALFNHTSLSGFFSSGEFIRDRGSKIGVLKDSAVAMVIKEDIDQ